MKGRTLFVLRTFNDVDHIAPLIWKFAQKGENPFVLFHSSHDYNRDYRIRYLMDQYQVEVMPMPDHAYEKYSIQLGSEGKNTLKDKIKLKLYNRIRLPWSPLGRLYRRFFFDCSPMIELLKSKNIRAAVFEWNSPWGRGEVLEKIFYSCKGLGIPTFSIPHGCNIYLNSDVHDRYVRQIKRGKLPQFSDRNEFDVTVVQSRFHLEHMVRFGLDRNKAQAWGSTRFAPEWQQINLSLNSSFVPQKEVLNRLKVVFMLPHWNYNVFKEKALSLIEKCASFSWIHLVIKDHTRADVGLLPKAYQEKFKHQENVEVDFKAHSPALIAWADVVINFGSSIGLEVLLQNKTLIHPAYLHSNWTIFDETGAAYLAESEVRVLELLKAKQAETLPPLEQEKVDKIFQSIIYGGRTAFNPLDFYYDQIKTQMSLI